MTKAQQEREQEVAKLRATALEQRRAYNREAKRASREKAKAAAEEGRVEARADVVRAALARAALVILATGAPGSTQVSALVCKAVGADPATGMSLADVVLADAGLIILATGAPGSKAVEQHLAATFAARPGVVGTLKAKARSGKLRPRVLTPELLRN